MTRAGIAVILASLALALGSLPACAQDNSNGDGKDHPDPIYTLPPPPAALQQAYKDFDTGQRALGGADDPRQIASPMSRTVSVSLAPGAVTNIIQIAQGYPASVTFLDSTGQPWPIAWNIATQKHQGCDGKDGNSNDAVHAIGIESCVPDAGSNVIQITPVNRYLHGGMLVNLQGAPKPVTFMFIAGTGRYDADLTVRVLERGPNAKEAPPLDANIPTTGAPELTAMLDDVPPADAVPLLVSGVSPDRMRAWKLRNSIYLRTDYELISPSAQDHEAAYGFTVYRIPVTRKILVSSGGQLIGVSLSEDGP